jgi:hypothetical protein
LSIDEPLSTQALLDEAMRQTRRHFKAIYPAVAVPLAVGAALMPLAQALWFQSLRFPTSGPEPAQLPLFIVGMIVFVLVALVFLAVYVLGYAALLSASVDACAGRPVSMSRAWLSMVKPQALGTLVMSWLATVAGMVCCFFPGIYVALIFSLVVAVMVEEGRFLVDGLRRSVELTSYNPRRSFGDDPRVRAFLILFVGMLIGYAVSMVVQMPLVILQQVMIFRGMAGGEKADPLEVMASMTWLQVPTNALAMLAQVAVHLYVSFGLALLYFDVRRRKEGRDLEQAADVLAQRAPAAEPGA